MKSTLLPAQNEKIAVKSFMEEMKRYNPLITESQVKVLKVEQRGRMTNNSFWYQVIYEMVTADVVGGSTLTEVPVGNADSYAPGDARNLFGQPGKKRKKKDKFPIHRRPLYRGL